MVAIGEFGLSMALLSNRDRVRLPSENRPQFFERISSQSRLSSYSSG
jgi:hypothetical protein